MSQPVAVVTALCDSAALLLLVSGTAKLRAPQPTVAALRSLRLRAVRPPAHVVRAGAIAEVALAGWMLAGGGRAAAVALAAAYLGFGAVAARLIATGSDTACGCFGAASAPAGRAHLGVCVAGVAVALAAVAEPVGTVGTLLAPDPALGVATAVLAVALTAAAYLCLTALPDLLRG